MILGTKATNLASLQMMFDAKNINLNFFKKQRSFALNC
jgi:hypothetical protein